MPTLSLVKELQRRNVFRVAVAYVVIGWVAAQVAEFAFENFGAPEWVLKTVVVVLMLGLPFAIFLAWAYELTPEGVKPEREVDRSQSITKHTGRKLDFVIIAALVVALGYFILERQPGDAVSGSTESVGATLPEQQSEPTSDEIDRSIAVIPFVNMSSDQEQEWFADGLTEEILNALARTPDLKVTARTSSFVYKNSNEDVPTIADALGVAHILEGSVRRAGERIRVTAQLIRAEDGFHLWSETYDRDVDDLIKIQEDVAIQIANALDTAMDPAALAQMVEAGTASIPAFEAYLEGLSFGLAMTSLGDPYDFLQVKEAYERAIVLDPGFARAHWGLARFWEIQLDTSLIISGLTGLPREEILENYFRSIEMAIDNETNPVSITLYQSSKARVEMKSLRAARLLENYIEQMPNDQLARRNYVMVLSEIADLEKLEALVDEIQERDVRDRGFAILSMSAMLFLDDKERIRRDANMYMQHYPDDVGVAYQVHRSLLWAGDIDGASRVVPMIRQSDMGETSKHLVLLRQACAENRIEDARRMYESALDKFADDRSIVWLSHTIMNETDRANAELMPLDDPDNLRELFTFINYGWFDVGAFPNLSAFLDDMGVVRPEHVPQPYRCEAS